MPYIDAESRSELDSTMGIDGIITFKPTPGELNYIITKLLLATEPKCYRDFNELVGVLECCKLEFYSRAVRKYEDEKIAQNGDIY
jgi:hypothetical protein